MVQTPETIRSPILLVSPHALRHHEPESSRLHVDLTRDHADAGPAIETGISLPRHHEIACAQHFGWPAWWEEVELPSGRSCNPALRSSILGYGVDSLNRYVGAVADYVVDDQSWEIRYLVVQTQGWDTHEWLLLSPSWITDLGQGNNVFTVGLRCEEMGRAPAWQQGVPVTREFEELLHDHYGRRGHWQR